MVNNAPGQSSALRFKNAKYKTFVDWKKMFA
jgi:hypothetical protein